MTSAAIPGTKRDRGGGSGTVAAAQPLQGDYGVTVRLTGTGTSGVTVSLLKTHNVLL